MLQVQCRHFDVQLRGVHVELLARADLALSGVDGEGIFNCGHVLVSIETYIICPCKVLVGSAIREPVLDFNGCLLDAKLKRAGYYVFVISSEFALKLRSSVEGFLVGGAWLLHASPQILRPLVDLVTMIELAFHRACALEVVGLESDHARLVHELDSAIPLHVVIRDVSSFK